MSAEIELLLCCTHTNVNSQQAERIRQLVQQNLDWQYVLTTADEHGVMPLLYCQLKALCQLLPTQVWNKLSSAFQANALRNMGLTAQLVKLQQYFHNQQIPFLAFKGSVLAQLAYDNVALRQFVDLDILVKEEYVSEASQLLINQGYQPQFNFTPQQQQKYLNLRSEHTFWHPEKQISVDLHWSILPQYFSFSPNSELIWSQCQQVSFAGTKITTLSMENLLLFLCAHSAKHNWTHLCWLCDIAELLQSNPDLDWDLVEAQTGQLGNRTMLYVSLYLVHDLLGANLPDVIVRKISDNRKIKAIAEQVKAALFIDKSNFIGSFPVADIYLQTMELWQDKLWYWFDAVMTPTPLEWAIIPLPKWLFPLYYPIRLMRLTLKIGKK